MLDIVLKLCPKFSPLFKIWNFNTLIVVVTDPKNCKTVLKSCVSKPEEINFLTPGIGHGLFVLTDQEWRQRKKLLNKSFSLSILNGYFEIFKKYSQNFISILEKNVGKEVEVDSLFSFHGFELVIGNS